MTARRTAFSAYQAARGIARSTDERLLDVMGDIAAARLLPEGAAGVAWEIAKLSGLDDDERRAFALIALSSMLATGAGSTRLPLPSPLLAAVTREAADALGPRATGIVAALDAPEALAARATGVVGTRASDRPLLLDGGALAAARLFRAEEEIARTLRPRVARTRSAVGALVDVVAAPTHGTNGDPTTLTDEQRRAVLASCEGGLSIVTGGPGTGKTSVLVALLRTLVRTGVAPSAIALAAPTGKAAERMTESTANALASLRAPADRDIQLAAALPRASTLHRLLSYSPARRAFARGPDDPLPFDVVIVDEASMIDVELGRALCAALQPTTRVVLLGDPDQLPPVGAGALLQDLADALPTAVSRLTISHRMRASDPAGSAVLAFSRAIAAGDVRDADVKTAASADDLSMRGVAHLPTAALGSLLDLLATRHVDEVATPLQRSIVTVDGAPSEEATGLLRTLLTRAASVRVLSPVHGGPLGTEALSFGIQQRVLRRLPRGHRGPPPGTPVLVVENDYARGLFNGDHGLVVRVQRGGATNLEVAFASADGVSLHPWDALSPRVELTHALTVHKSQGSECDVVVLALADTPEGLASRALLYTAVTRAKTGVVLVGELASLDRRVRATTPRSSNLAALLAAPGQG